jgi:hypothetical protein
MRFRPNLALFPSAGLSGLRGFARRRAKPATDSPCAIPCETDSFRLALPAMPVASARLPTDSIPSFTEAAGGLTTASARRRHQSEDRMGGIICGVFSLLP